MSEELFFNSLIQNIKSGLPLVCYRLPGQQIINSLVQNNKKTFRIKDFSESGFIFAPFQNTKDTLFIPQNEAVKSVLQNFNHDSITIGKSEFSNREDTEAKHFHISLVNKAIESIEENDLKKVVLSRKERVDTTLSVLEIFKNLLGLYPNAFIYLWSHPETGIWLGATPETLLKTNRTKFATMALAGTRKMENATFDDWTEKERNEQQIVTDSILLEFQKLGISENELEITEPYNSEAGNLVHLRTDISGTFKKNTSELGLILKALHPTPAVGGLPKDLAAKYILEHENYNREYYTGYLGELNKTIETKRNSRTRNQENQAYTSIRKESSLYVNLRCIKFKNQEVEIFVGGGITKDSNANAEWEETVNKTLTIKAAL